MSNKEETSSLDRVAQLGAAAVRNGAAASVSTGIAFGGPIGTLVGTVVTSKTFWKLLGAVAAVVLLWLLLLINLISIICSYLGFADANSFVDAAKSSEVSELQTMVTKILEQEEYRKEIFELMEAEQEKQIQEIQADKRIKYKEFDLKLVNEYEARLKKNPELYLTILLTEVWDTNTIHSFIGDLDSGGTDIEMDTELSSPYDPYFEEVAKTYGVPVALLKAVGKVESNYNPNAVSYVGAQGIMQLMPATAASLGVTDAFDPKQNIMGGAKYIVGNLEQFKFCDNALELAIAAYNAGPGAVVKAGYQIPAYMGVKEYVEKVLGYVTILESDVEVEEQAVKQAEEEPVLVEEQESKVQENTGEGSKEDLKEAFQLLKAAVTEYTNQFFSWTVTNQIEEKAEKKTYYHILANEKKEIDRTTYQTLKAAGENVRVEKIIEKEKKVEYTLALLLNSQLSDMAHGYKYKTVTDRSTFELLLKLIRKSQQGKAVARNGLFSEFSWTDFVTGSGKDEGYIGTIDVTGDQIVYDTVENCIKEVTYFNQGEEPWRSMAYGSSTIGAAGCGPTSLAMIITTLTGQTVTPEMTCAYAIDNGEYVSGLGTSHSFPTNAASDWGLSVKRAGKDQMDTVIAALKSGKLVLMICRENTITSSGNGHFIVLTGVTKEGYLTIADCASRERTSKIYSIETILSYGRDLNEGAFWIIEK